MITDNENILNEMFDNLTAGLLEAWYPLAVDNTCGGYYTNLSYDMKLMPDHEKMVVTQARHIWSNSKAYKFLSNKNYKDYALHGFEFLDKYMWDDEYSGFYQMRSRDGRECDAQGFFSEKRTYGNAFAIYGLAALYDICRDDKVLDKLQQTFAWIEKYAYDKVHKGYFQFLTREGQVVSKDGKYRTKAFDEVESAYKDQNSSIHILEAYTELYHVWPDPKLKQQLENILTLVRDAMVHPEGYLRLFFEHDWTPVSFRHAPRELREANYRLDHVSFGHDYETAFLMLEASYILGIDNDIKTLRIARQMIDHAIQNGWDDEKGGFYEEGYYFPGEYKCSIINDAKNWWSQAEGLNALLLFSKIFPGETDYYKLFTKLWNYTKQYLIDHENGDWYWGGLDKQPFHSKTPKGSIWKGTYHNCRGLMNCIMMLDECSDLLSNSEGYKQMKKNFDNMVEHWRLTAKQL